MIWDYFVISFNNLRNRRMRSFLTVLGVVIGIAAVVGLISIGQGMQEAILEQFEQIGSDTLTILGKAGSMVSPAASAFSG